MNRKEFKNAMSGVQSSEQTIERIMDMTNRETKKHFKSVPTLALVACLAILVTGILGGSAFACRLNPVGDTQNAFTITAYAKDSNDNEKKIDLSENQIAKTEVRLQLVYDVLNSVNIAGTGFRVEGKSIKSVSYFAQRGSFNYQSLNSNDFSKPEIEAGYDSSKPYSTKITFDYIGDKETMEVFYSPTEAVNVLLHADNSNFDYSTLPADTITISVEFNDGSKAEKSIRTSFDKDGYMLMEYTD